MIELMALPYHVNALEPYLSADNVSKHYHLNHKHYVDKTNELIKGTALENADIQHIVMVATGELKNIASQVINHNSFWHSLKPKANNKPDKEFDDAFVKAGMSVFGSGWLYCHGHDRKLITAKNADIPLDVLSSNKRVIAIDLWEHAFNEDYPADRKGYLTNVLRIIDWT